MPSKTKPRPGAQRPSIRSDSKRALSWTPEDADALREFVSTDTFFYARQEAIRRSGSASVSQSTEHQSLIQAGINQGIDKAFQTLIEMTLREDAEETNLFPSYLTTK